MNNLLPARTSGPAMLGAWRLDSVVQADALDLLRGLPSESVNCIVTSPPYFGLRDYQVAGQIGLEPTPAAYVAALVAVFREARRVLRDDGTFWLNVGDSYVSAWASGRRSVIGQGSRTNRHNRIYPEEGIKEKDKMGIPHRLVFALQDDGWIWRDEIIWHKRAPMPESVTDRCTKAHEFVFMLTKQPRYWYDQDAIREPAQDWGERDRTNGKYHNPGTGLTPHRGLTGGNFSKRYADAQPNHGGESNRVPYASRNKRSVWTLSPEPNSFAHFATYPTKLVEPCILAGCPVGGVVLDPFMGSGTTAIVAQRLQRHYIGSELNADYVDIARQRIGVETLPLALTFAQEQPA